MWEQPEADQARIAFFREHLVDAGSKLKP